MKLYKDPYAAVDVLTIVENPFPRLTKLELDIPDGVAVEGLHSFPSLKSLTLDGDMTYL